MIEDSTIATLTVNVNNQGMTINEYIQPKEETKPEVPHRDLQIQWHEDRIHSLKTGEPMTEWEVRYDGGKWYRVTDNAPSWYFGREYRRKPRTKKVTYWHCVGRFVDRHGLHCKKSISDVVHRDLKLNITFILQEDPTAKFSPITETTVEIPED